MLTPGENESPPMHVSQPPPTYRREGESNHEGESNQEGENTVLAVKLRELQVARPYMEKKEYEKAKKVIIDNFVVGASIDLPGPPIGQPTQNQYDKPKIVQIRVSDSTGAHEFDDNTYWLEKDGYSYSRVPESLARDGLILGEWQEFHDNVREATDTLRCHTFVWCLLGGPCSPLACVYCYGKDWCLRRELLRICRHHEEIWMSYGIKIKLTTFGSLMEMASTPYPHKLSKEDREEKCGVYVFQLIPRNYGR